MTVTNKTAIGRLGSGFTVTDGVISATGTIGGTAGTTDNAIVRADGTGGSILQPSLASIDDNGGINIPLGQTYNVNGVAHTHDYSGTFATTEHTHDYSSTYQPLDSDLTSIAGLDSGSNVGKVIAAKTGGGYELAKLADVNYSSVSETATLPASPSTGDVYEFIGTGTNWTLTANAGQYIRFQSALSGSGGTISSRSGYDCVCMVYIGSNVWLVKTSNGVLDVI